MIAFKHMLWAILVILAIYILVWMNHVRRKLKYILKMPGPPGAPIIGNLMDMNSPPDELFQHFRRYARDYFPLYRLTVGFDSSVNINGPEEIELIISSMKNMAKGMSYDFMIDWLGTGLLISTGEKWQTRRKLLTPAFHFSILQQFIGIFHEETDKLVKELEKECEKEYIDVIPVVTEFALNTINETSMGTTLDMKNKEQSDYKQALYDIGKVIIHRSMRPWLFLPAIYYLSPSGRKEKSLLKTLHTFTRNVISRRAENFKDITQIDTSADSGTSYSKRKRLAMLDLLLNLKINEGKIDDEGIREEVDTFMFEGHDTTSVGICFTLMLLACNRDVQDRIYDELQTVLGDTKYPTYADLQELKYMERAIKESLRLYPSVPFIARTCEEDITTRGGYVIPKGAEISIHIYDLHRNPDIYPDPEKFDPDRFLPENSKNRNPYAYIPFSAGPRNCIGQRFAILEIKAVLCGILKKFILEPVDTPDTLVLFMDLVLRAKDKIRVKFVLRENITTSKIQE